MNRARKDRAPEHDTALTKDERAIGEWLRAVDWTNPASCREAVRAIALQRVKANAFDKVMATPVGAGADALLALGEAVIAASDLVVAQIKALGGN